jgi:hypothetical protein
VRGRERATGDACRFVRGEAENSQDAFGVVDVGVVGGLAVEHGVHDSEQGAAYGGCGYALVGHMHAAGGYGALDVALSEWP